MRVDREIIRSKEGNYLQIDIIEKEIWIQVLRVSVTRERFQWRGTNRWGSMGKKNETRAGRRIPLKTIPFDDVAPRRPSASYLHSRSALLPLREYAGTFMPSSFNPVTVTKRGNKFFFLRKQREKKNARTNSSKPNQTGHLFAVDEEEEEEEPLLPPKSHQTLDLLYGTRTMGVLKKRRRREKKTPLNPPRDDISTIKSRGDRPSTPTITFTTTRLQEKLEKLRLDRMTKGCGGGGGGGTEDASRLY